MTKSQIMSQLLEISENSYFRWKKKDHKLLIDLIESCFTDEEIKQFLETNEIPYKIQFANKYFSQLNDEFTKYIMLNKGIKAILTALNYSENINITEFDTEIIKQYDKGKINRTDLTQYFQNIPSNQLKMYILDNHNKNWQFYYDSQINNCQSWIIDYFKIMLISIKKDIFDIFFSKTYVAIPRVDKLYTTLYYSDNKKFRNSALCSKFNTLLLNIYDKIINNKYQELPLYLYLDQFNSEMYPLLATEYEITDHEDPNRYLLVKDMAFLKEWYQKNMNLNLEECEMQDIDPLGFKLEEKLITYK